MTPSTVLDFWFGELDPADHRPTPAHMKLWFQGGADADATIRERFGQTLEDAAAGKLDEWKQTAEGYVALIIVLDQFPRNIFRGSEKAFSFDSLALSLSKEAMAHGNERAVHPLLATFMLLPLEHSESLEDQELCVSYMRDLAQQVHEEARGAFLGFLDYAVQHRDIIKEFGRFPHRNALLNRTSTPEEISFLERDDVHFGQKTKN